jgi:hypothetical protein
VTDPQWVRDRRAIFRVCAAFSLTRGDRLHVAAVLLNREVGSFADLSPGELSRLRDAMEGAALVCHIQIERRQAARKAANVTVLSTNREGT